MRRVKLRFSPSLEQDDIQNQLQQALSEEKENEKVTEAELETPLNNKQGFDADEAAANVETPEETTATDETPPVTDETTVETETTETIPETPEETNTDAVSTDENVNDDSVDTATTDETTTVDETGEPVVTTDTVDSEGGEVTDVIAEQVVRQSSGEDNAGVKAFASKIKESYTLAQSKGFTGSFDDFLQSLTETITVKENEVVQNPLGTTSGSGDVVEPESKANALDESDASAVNDDVTTTDETTVDSTTDTDTIGSTSPDETINQTDETETSTDNTANTDDTELENTDSTDTTDTGATEDTSETNTSSTDVEGTEDTTQTETQPEESTDTSNDTETTSETSDTSTDEFTTDESTGSEETNLNGEPSFDDEQSSNDEAGEETEDDTVPEPEGKDDESLNEYMDEIDDEQEKVDDTDAMVQEAEDSSTRLGRIAEIVKDAIDESKSSDSEEINESLSKIAEIATECYANRFGIERKYSVMISNESLLEAISPLQRAEVSLEAAKDTLKKIVDAILKAIEAISRWVGEQWRNFQVKSGVLEKRLNKLEEILEKTEKDPEKKEIDNAALFATLNIGGQVTNVAQGVDKVAKEAKSIYSTFTDWTLDAVQAVLSETEANIKSGDHSIFYGYNLPDYGRLGLAPVQNPVADGYLSESESDQSDYVNVATGDELMGGKTLVLFAPKKDDAMDRRMKSDMYGKEFFVRDNYTKALRDNKFGVKFMDYKPNEKVVEGTTVSSLNLQEMKALVQSLKKLFKEIQAYKQIQPKIKPIRNKVTLYAKKLTLAENMKVLPENKLVQVAGIYRAVARQIDEPSVSFTNYALKIIAASMRYIQLSLGTSTQEANEPEAQPQPA